MNKFTIRQNQITNKTLNIPVELKWDYLGMDDTLDAYEVEMVNKVIGDGYDFEVTRFAHEPFGLNEETKITYEFNFYSGRTFQQNNWVNNYIAEGYTSQEIFYFRNNFANSFFKLDFYDSLDEKQQVNYITIILPTQQGLTMTASTGQQVVNIKRPTFVLDYVGDKEGYFIYWLKKRNFLDIKTFYMSAKFFNADVGQFRRMLNMPQTQQNMPNKNNFDNSKYFYYRVELDYDKQTYQLFNSLNNRVGTTEPIKWFEYVNP